MEMVWVVCEGCKEEYEFPESVEVCPLCDGNLHSADDDDVHDSFTFDNLGEGPQE